MEVYKNCRQLFDPSLTPGSGDQFDRQLGDRSPDGRMTGYNLAMSQVGHELGRRGSAFVSAKVR